MKRHILLVPTAALALACASTPKDAGPAPEAVGVEVQRVLPINESLDNSAVEVTLKLTNPRRSAVRVKEVRYSLDSGSVAGKLEGSATSGAEVAPEQEAQIKFKQEVPFPSEAEAYRALLEKGTVPVELKGHVLLEDGTEVPFERSAEVATPTLPKFVVHEAQAARYGKDGVDVTFFLRVINENVFSTLIQSASYKIEIGGKTLKEEQAALGLRMMGGAAEEYEVGTVLDEKSFDKAVLKEMLASRKITYTVSGKLDIARMSIPFSYDGEIELAGGE